MESSGLCEEIDNYFCFNDQETNYKCNLEKAQLIKEDDKYSIHFSFMEDSAYIYLYEEKRKIDLPLEIKTLEYSKDDLFVEYSTDGESIIKLMIEIKR